MLNIEGRVRNVQGVVQEITNKPLHPQPHTPFKNCGPPGSTQNLGDLAKNFSEKNSVKLSIRVTKRA